MLSEVCIDERFSVLVDGLFVRWSVGLSGQPSVGSERSVYPPSDGARCRVFGPAFVQITLLMALLGDVVLSSGAAEGWHHHSIDVP